MTINLCTYFDSRYLAKGLALLRSLGWHMVQPWHCYVLALDDLTFETIGGLHNPYVTCLPLRAIENGPLRRARAERSWKDYIFTLTPAWCLWLLERKELDSLAYIDADCCLFGDLAPLYAEVGEASVAVIPHRWTPRHADRLRPNGEFNVGWVYFRSDLPAIGCLGQWLDDCLGWRGPAGKFSDQTFLNDWPLHLGAALHVVQHVGANLAPWSAEQYRYMWQAGRIWVEGAHRTDDMGIGHVDFMPLLFYHFHELRELSAGGFYRTGYPVPALIAEHVYVPYEAEIASVRATA